GCCAVAAGRMRTGAAGPPCADGATRGSASTTSASGSRGRWRRPTTPVEGPAGGRVQSALPDRGAPPALRVRIRRRPLNLHRLAPAKGVPFMSSATSSSRPVGYASSLAYRTVDIVTVATLGVAVGVAFWGWDQIYTVFGAATNAFP